MAQREHWQAISNYFESLSPESVARMGEFYSADCSFKDPFNEVRGLAHTQRIFAHMFEAVHAPRFVVHELIVDGQQAFLTWDFLFTAKRLLKGEQCVRGSSHLRLNAQALVEFHRDYWDAAEELYEKLPVLGSLMRLLRNQNRVE